MLAAIVLIASSFSFSQWEAPRAETAPVGFAGVPGRGLQTTTGGAGGRVFYVRNADSLYTILRSLRVDKNPTLAPAIIIVDGTVNYAGDKMVYFKTNANITLVGKGNTAKFVGFGLEVETSYNIIIRNIEFNNCPVDGIDIRDPETHHIWVDHCTFTDGDVQDSTGSNHDGSLDIKLQASYITVSWCHFLNHSKTCLMGHDDDETADTVMTVSYHHNWFEKTRQRHPRVRFGKAHVFNNYYDSNDIYAIVSACEADVLVEGCYFKNVPYPSYVGYMSSGPGDLVQRNNIFQNCLNTPQTRGNAFEASNYYQYTLDAPASLPDLLRNYSGSGKIEIPTEAVKDLAPVSGYLTLDAFPNPFNPTSQIVFLNPAGGYTTLDVFDILGRKVTTLFAGNVAAGTRQNVKFEAADLSAGLYFAVLRCANQRAVQKMIFSK